VVQVARQQQGVVYLIHFERPYEHARHYCGWVHSRTFLEPRLGAPRDGAGARLMAVITAAGIGWEVVRTWHASRDFERRLKRQGGLSRHCPTCRATGIYHR
jgi:hypothetical protein